MGTQSDRRKTQRDVLGLVLATALVIGASVARADTLAGNAYGVASSTPWGTSPTGTHVHDSLRAEVGSWSTAEEVRGLSEFSLAGQSAAGSATLSFEAVFAGGAVFGQSAGAFDVSVVAYQANNLIDLSDFQAPSVATIGGFSTAGMTVGTMKSFDLSSVYNTAIANGWTAFGVRLQAATNPGNHRAWDFGNFEINTTSLAAPVPLPAAAWGGMALMGLIGAKRLRRRQQDA